MSKETDDKNENEESNLSIITEKNDDRSDFSKAFEDDSLWQLQDRMHAKAKTKRFTPEDFINKAETDLETELEVIDSKIESSEPTPEPEDVIEEDERWF